MQKKLGRPRLPEGKVREGFIKVRVSPREKTKIEADAKRDGLNISDYIRKKLL